MADFNSSLPVVGSVAVTNIVAVRGNLGIVFDAGDNLDVTVIAGSVQSYGQLGSVEIWQTINSNLQVQATQETSPWIVLGSVNIDNIVAINGSVSIVETIPTDNTKINFAIQLLYSGTLIGSLISHNPAGGSFVQVLSYDASDNLINVGSWV